MSGWIKVQERLPERGVPVLVWIDTGPDPLDWEMAVMWKLPGLWDGALRTLFDDGKKEVVTHWKPLPVAPLKVHGGES